MPATGLRVRDIRTAGQCGGNVPALEAPEEVLVVSFTGLTEAEQRKALAGFPGGRRFRLEADVEAEAISTGEARRDSSRSI